ncbi:hypothetical protein [Promicromonospora sp. NPDC050880]|uniref:hypothetical protein n=1 Tax=Promicromonospora sp. NPDC050880 TaxID=3364406 RepID=UPI0037AECCCA
MQVKRRCAMCAKEFEARRPHARYCSDTCRKRARRAGAAAAPAPSVPVVVDGPSGRAARAWLTEKAMDAARTPAAADLLVVADAIDTATVAGQIQFVAALARQAAALRAELEPRTDDPEGQEQAGGGQGAPGDSSGDGGPERRSFDAAAL